MRILITGGAGFIGANLAEYLVNKGHQVVVFDNLYTGTQKNIEHLGNKIEFIRGDIRYSAPLIAAMKDVEAVCHLAAIPVVPMSFLNPRETFDTNLYGTLNVLESALKAGVKKVIFSSSASVYGLNSSILYEDLMPSPESPYAITKVGMEQLLKIFFKSYGLDTCSLRIFNPYGKYHKIENFAAIPNFIVSALKNKPLVIQGSGTQTRDFIYVDDVSRAFDLAMGAPTRGEVFNIASGKSVSILELANTIKELTNSKSEIQTVEKRQGDVKESFASTTKAKMVLGFEAKQDLRTGLTKTIDYYKSCI